MLLIGTNRARPSWARRLQVEIGVLLRRGRRAQSGSGQWLCSNMRRAALTKLLQVCIINAACEPIDVTSGDVM